MRHNGHYLKKLNQSNHENTVIPESVSQYSTQPLYIIIAIWCQQQDRWINCNDIAQAFSMQVRRASFQLSYITRRPRHITFRSRQQMPTHGGKRHPINEIWVEKVIIESEGQSIERAPPTGKGVMGAYRSRVGNGMSGSRNIWDAIVMMRQAKEEENGE